MSQSRLIVLAVGILTAVSSPLPAQVERSRHGDTTVVRTTGPGLWGAPKTAVEEKRLGGPGSDIQFMLVSSIGIAPTGQVIAADERERWDATVYILGPDGSLTRKLLLLDTVRLGMRAMAARDSTIFVAQTSILERFTMDGRLLGRVPLPRGAPGGLTKTAAHGSFYRPEATIYEVFPGAPGPPIRMPELLVDSSGQILKTIPAPSSPYTNWPRGRFDPRAMDALLDDGTYVTAVSDTLGFVVHSGTPGGGYIRAIVPMEAPRYIPEEREEWKKVWEFQKTLRSFPGSAPLPDSTPERKQLLLGILTDDEGRIWLRHTTTAVKGPERVMVSTGAGAKAVITWDDQPAYDVFRRDGTFLGDVTFPAGARIMAMSGDVVWAVMPSDKPKEQYVIKYRIPGAAGVP